MARGKKVEEEKKDVIKEEGEESEEKSSGTLSDGVLDAFDEETPVAGLEEEDLLAADDEDEALDDMDFRTSEDW